MRALRGFGKVSAAGVVAIALAVGGAGTGAIAAAPTWSTPVALGTIVAGAIPNIATDAATGLATAAWAHPADPDIAVNPVTGLVMVVWTQRDDDGHAIVTVRESQRGGVFSPPVNVSLGGHDALNPRIALDSVTGLVTVVWTRWNGTNHVVQASRSLGGGDFSTPDDVSSPGQDAGQAFVAMDATGRATVIFKYGDGTDMQLLSSTLAGPEVVPPAVVAPAVVAPAASTLAATGADGSELALAATLAMLLVLGGLGSLLLARRNSLAD